MKLLLIMNPGSHAGRGKRRWATWVRGLDLAGADYDRATTERAGHALELARGADGYDAVVAVGGDGTVNEVLDGVVQSNRPAMGVLYAGTSPDFCKFHGIPVEPERALRVLLAGHTRAVDVARITYHDADGRERVGHFGCSCNIGIGASVARCSNQWRPFVGDALGTLAAVVRSLLVVQSVDLELEIDGRSVALPATHNLSVAKNPYLASGLKLDLDLRSDDGALRLVGLHGKSTAGLLAMAPSFYSGSVAARSDVLVESGQSVAIRSRTRQEIEFDGDPRGFLPARIEILPKALNLITPAHNNE